tara:strand:- start:12294 stop:12479 length:186 start_codon:yes stop_codon:yes gene_type:complete
MAEYVDGMSSLSVINRVIRMPERLTADDGTVFEIMKWRPDVTKGHYVKVDLEVRVMTGTGE